MHTPNDIESLKKRIEYLENQNALLKHEVQKFRHAIDNSPVTIVITDNEGNIEFANPAFERITGYCCSDVLGKNPRFLKSNFHNTEFYAELWGTITSGEPWMGEFYNRKKDGSFYWEEAYIGPIKNNSGEITNYIAIKLDITFRKQAEAQLTETNQQLRESNATKDKLFSIIGHDLKNPFWAILSFASLLSENAENYSPKDVREMSSMMLRSAQNIYDLLENLLQWARSQTGRIEVNNQSLNLYNVVNDTVVALYEQASTKKISIENELPLSQKVYSDTNLLSTVMRNLLSNAIKFTPENGTVGFRSTELENNIEVTVWDSGTGIPQADLPSLFSHENKRRTRGTANEGGTGLGLVLCKEFIEKMGGTIRVKCEPEQGCQFIFSLPKA